jgi:hypothetical protein
MVIVWLATEYDLVDNIMDNTYCATTILLRAVLASDN